MIKVSQYSDDLPVELKSDDIYIYSVSLKKCCSFFTVSFVSCFKTIHPLEDRTFSRVRELIVSNLEYNNEREPTCFQHH